MSEVVEADVGETRLLQEWREAPPPKVGRVDRAAERKRSLVRVQVGPLADAVFLWRCPVSTPNRSDTNLTPPRPFLSDLGDLWRRCFALFAGTSERQTDVALA